MEIAENVLEDCAKVCLALGADGLRGELTLLRAARSIAAYEGVAETNRSHVEKVALSALRHRLRRDPLDEAGSSTRVKKIITEVLK